MQRDPEARALGLQDLLLRLRQTPWKFGFTALMRRIGALHPQRPPIGQALRPQQEPFRLGQAAALTFAPREIAEAVLPGDGAQRSVAGHAPPGIGATPRTGNNPALPVIRLYGLGLLGPNGPLPLHYTETVRERTESHSDATLADFLDIFHHRYFTHMHRAWAQSQAAAGLDRAQDEAFSRYVARLTGHDPLEIRDSVLPSHARLAASTYLGSDARNPDGLARTLAHFFAVPVRLDEFVMHWIRIDDEDRSCLGQPRMSSVMGVGAFAGEVVADRQSKFRLVLGPLSLAQYLRFTPQGRDLPMLIEWVRAFVGYEFVWELELRVRSGDAEPTRLGDAQRLGWSSWVGHAVEPDRSAPGDAGTGHAVGMVFEPERYAPFPTTAIAAA